jgi:hypothetical protein
VRSLLPILAWGDKTTHGNPGPGWDHARMWGELERRQGSVWGTECHAGDEPEATQHPVSGPREHLVSQRPSYRALEGFTRLRRVRWRVLLATNLPTHGAKRVHGLVWVTLRISDEASRGFRLRQVPSRRGSQGRRARKASVAPTHARVHRTAAIAPDRAPSGHPGRVCGRRASNPQLLPMPVKHATSCPRTSAKLSFKYPHQQLAGERVLLCGELIRGLVRTS